MSLIYRYLDTTEEAPITLREPEIYKVRLQKNGLEILKDSSHPAGCLLTSTPLKKTGEHGVMSIPLRYYHSKIHEGLSNSVLCTLFI